MEECLDLELGFVEAITRLWADYPNQVFEIAGILTSVKDPISAIGLIKDQRVLSPTEMFVIAHLCFSVQRLRQAMKATGMDNWPKKAVPPSLRQLQKQLFPGVLGQPVFYINDGYSPTLAKTRAERKQKEKIWREEMLKEADRVHSVLGRKPGLKEEIAIKKTNHSLLEKARLMPELAETRETMTHVHFRLKATKTAVRLERDINRLKQKEQSLEDDVLSDLLRKLVGFLPVIEEAANAIGELDFLVCKARLARSMDAVRPKIVKAESGAKNQAENPCKAEAVLTKNQAGNEAENTDETASVLTIFGAVHPIIKEEVESRGGKYQPVSISIDSPVSVITGPNMGGKTVALATVGLCVALVQWGLLAPCQSIELSLYDFLHFQSQEGETPGLSSFATEIVGLKEPVSRIAEKGLVLLDEVGRGTNPSQGMALYAALLMYYLENPDSHCTVLATTHYHGLADLLGVSHWQVKGLNIDQSPIWSNGSKGLDWLYNHMDYTLIKVGPDTPIPCDALVVAKVLGLNKNIVQKAQTFYDSDQCNLEVKEKC